jgi:hypothetical protein
VQLAAAPDGRLFVSDGDRRVRVVRAGEESSAEPALEIALLTSRAAGPMGIAGHPDFAENHFVYVSFLEREKADTIIIRVVRLRAVGDALGEPATLYQAAVVATTTVGHESVETTPMGTPRMAFGPDRLLYVMLPTGFEVVKGAGASTPRGSMLRLTQDGTVPSAGPLTGITSDTLGFTWHPTTGDLWVVARGDTKATVRSFTAGGPNVSANSEQVDLRVQAAAGVTPAVLLLQASLKNRAYAERLVASRGRGGWVARLAVPAQSDPDATADGIGDVVGGADGTVFITTRTTVANESGTSTVVVRLRPAQP